jgi:hypothetical protein
MKRIALASRADVLIARVYVVWLRAASTIFLAFGMRRFLDRHEYGWLTGALCARAVIDVVGRACVDSVTGRALRELCRARAFDDGDSNGSIEGFDIEPRARDRRIAAGALVAIAIACVVHSGYLGYVEEADAFSALILLAECVMIAECVRWFQQTPRHAASERSVPMSARPPSEPAVSQRALSDSGNVVIAIVGDGRGRLLDRIIRAREKSVVSVLETEWTIPEPFEVCCRVNRLVYGTAATRVNALERARLIERLEHAMCSSSRSSEYAVQPQRIKDDLDGVESMTIHACDVGIERARRARVKCALVAEPCHETSTDPIARVHAIKRALCKDRELSVIFTTTDFAVLPWCDRIVVTEGDEVVFIGNWLECDRRTVHRAFLTTRSFKTPSTHRVLIDDERSVVERVPSSTKTDIGVTFCLLASSSISLYAFERWLDGKRRWDSGGNALLAVSIALFVMHEVIERISERWYNPNHSAMSPTLFVAIGSSLVAPNAWMATLALAVPCFIACTSRFGFQTETDRALREEERARTQMTHFTTHLRRGWAQISVARCEEMYEEIFTNLLKRLDAALTRSRTLRVARDFFVYVCIIAFVASILRAMDESETTRRGSIALIWSAYAFDAFVRLDRGVDVRVTSTFKAIGTQTRLTSRNPPRKLRRISSWT